MTTLSLNEIRNNLANFTIQWRDFEDERAGYQMFWLELLQCFGVSTRQVAVYEKAVKRLSTGNTGFIDFFWPGLVIGENKGKGKMGKHGEKAEAQAFDYLMGGSIKEKDMPRYVVSVDFEHFRITDLEERDENGEPKTIFSHINDLPDHVDDLAFLGGYTRNSLNTTEQEAVSIKAAQDMARLYEAIVGTDADEVTGEDDDTKDASVLLTRLLFLMFGDDTGLWNAGLFQDFIENRTREDGSDLIGQLTTLFQVLSTPKRPKNLDESLAKFPYVNGGVFNSADHLGLIAGNREMRNAILQACSRDWTAVSPAVFGSLFQTVKSKEARRSAGEHYTTETNIMKVIEDLFLRDWRERIEKNKGNRAKLREIRQEMANSVFVDPACGCGNFLVVAYRELRRLEHRIIELLDDGAARQMMLDATMELKVRPEQFHGIEISWWPAKIAETAMYLADHQANRELMLLQLGNLPERLPLRPEWTAKIHHTNALTADWEELIPKPTRSAVPTETGKESTQLAQGKLFIFGNPPFVGQKQKNDVQKQNAIYVWGGGQYNGYLDFVACWHKKSIDLFAQPGYLGEFAFVTTNSITQGVQVDPLFSFIFGNGWKIKYAHRTFAWTTETTGGAAVHCVIIGFTKDEVTPRLYDYHNVKDQEAVTVPVKIGINGYLVDGANIIVKKKTGKALSPSIRPASIGGKPAEGGHLIVEPEDYAEVAADPIARKYLRPFRMGKELVNNLDRWCLWMAGSNFNPNDLTKSSLLKKRIEAVQQVRLASTKAQTRECAATPYLFQEVKEPDKPYIGIPVVVSETRIFYTVDYFEQNVIPGNKVYFITEDIDLQFALLSSSAFIVWQKAIGGRMKSDVSFANTLTWNTFPVPELTDKQRDAIIAGGKAVLEARQLQEDKSLADMYNPLAMRPELLKAHAKLDKAVDAVFGLKVKPTEGERLTAMFEYYQKLTNN